MYLIWIPRISSPQAVVMTSFSHNDQNVQGHNKAAHRETNATSTAMNQLIIISKYHCRSCALGYLLPQSSGTVYTPWLDLSSMVQLRYLTSQLGGHSAQTVSAESHAPKPLTSSSIPNCCLAYSVFHLLQLAIECSDISMYSCCLLAREALHKHSRCYSFAHAKRLCVPRQVYVKGEAQFKIHKIPFIWHAKLTSPLEWGV